MLFRLRRALTRAWPAAQGKNVLRKEPMGREIGDEDVFFYNAAFTSKFYKVKVGTVSAQKETEPEKADTRHKARPALLAPPAGRLCLHTPACFPVLGPVLQPASASQA